ncbi:MAG: rod shape-determining protein MreD [Candidatus Nitrotoga sp.]|nr:rod shape-determining protein MreD [Candidatus Nitrotoga sp.]MBP0117179.1 rod shape-determining protein MreD [Candidatus Nitrotoga sp.]MBP0125879.1 rod shape-determining protein MreD [Candidatus Nitrotoga sp.]
MSDYQPSLPAHTALIVTSLFVALLLSWLPWHGFLLIIRPDFVALVLLYWSMQKPNHCGIGIAWTVGIIADVADASFLGQHALVYAVLAFCGIVLQRRLSMLSLSQQALQVFPLLLLAYSIYVIVHWQLHGYVSWVHLLGSVVSALLWLPVTTLLQKLCHARASSSQR